MSMKQLLFRNLKQNIQHYYLYVFALMFASALYFAFVTLQYDPSLDAIKGGVKGAAAVRTGAVLLIVIVAVFLLYANALFIKRRSHEIALLQLIGMTKRNIFFMLAAENVILYYGTLIIGILVGFAASKLLMMILFKIIDIPLAASLSFSGRALVQTLIVFSVIDVLMMGMNRLFLKKQTILSLFRTTSTTEAKHVSVWNMVVGMVGIILIASGYGISTKLFSSDWKSVQGLFMAMAFILGAVIIGTYLFFKGTISFLFHLWRKQKGGYLSINAVLSGSSLMFRMKSNALLLTIITTVSAIAIGLISLSYISYYSAERSAQNYVAADFAFTDKKDAARFTAALRSHDIRYRETMIDVIEAPTDISMILDIADQSRLQFQPSAAPLSVISDTSTGRIDVKPNEALLTGYQDILRQFLPFKETGTIRLEENGRMVPLHYLGMKKDYYVNYHFTYGMPTVIVDQTMFDRLQKETDPQKKKVHIGIHLTDETNIERADQLFQRMEFSSIADSRLMMSRHRKQTFGLIMFVVTFLGLAFLVTSGCILYFKQMGAGEEERPNYTILRKLGFTEKDLLGGIRRKQLFYFGIPLLLGLSHSYFAVRSGWFFFGTELWMPMLTVMAIYTVCYSLFGVLSVRYYKKLIREAL
ncbi:MULTISPECIES: FtsX-like permease family protein [unclassified Geobacillus]|uniref:FtsX-like permease family protein n=1 Tax=unclassified Geobacillus TaxID=2642459 RepID=UPI000C2847A5|nr:MULTISPECIES: ABC transporter permease [unclassified Geobacillus]PJW15442.1 bacitracin ABC transporter permease [Geobacillus sp. Manikaran-105]PJW18520.1 bacitracin ABC transporter permease [Geobacillus sp. WSUCF-018B]